MPHKHTRRQVAKGSLDLDLPPETIARPLPVLENHAKAKKKQDRATRRQKSGKRPGFEEDDTPRAFVRLMQFQETRTRLSGLDDGDNGRKRKKPKTAQSEEFVQPQVETAPQPSQQVPKIQPGERLGDYAARVDRALPVAGLMRKGKATKVDGVKDRQTKTEKRLHKMYAAWREEDARRKERIEEEQEQAEEREEHKRAMFDGQEVNLPQSRSRKRQRMIGEVTANDDGEDDPWQVLKEKRAAPKGLHDVAQAPPSFRAVPKEKFKMKNQAKVYVANVPAAAGSLRRREELSDARKEVIERYRNIMKGKSGL